jgi:putative oxidoreductase
VKSSWFSSPMHDPGRSLDIVRLTVATVLITHPLYAFFHPGNILGFGRILQPHGLPFGIVLAWAALSLQAVCSVALVTRRLVVPACIGHIFVLAIGICLIHAPRWRTVGLPDGEDRPGSEFSVLMIACLLGILWADRGRAKDAGSPSSHAALSVYRGLQIVRLSAALILIIHPLGGISDPTGLHDFGVYLSSIGYPFGVPLVWSLMFLQMACSLALASQRFVIPACLGHIFVLSMGIWLFHAPHWFAIGPSNVVSPGKEGMEYSVLLIACFFSLLLAYWPRPQHTFSTFQKIA